MPAPAVAAAALSKATLLLKGADVALSAIQIFRDVRQQQQQDDGRQPTIRLVRPYVIEAIGDRATNLPLQARVAYAMADTLENMVNALTGNVGVDRPPRTVGEVFMYGVREVLAAIPRALKEQIIRNARRLALEGRTVEEVGAGLAVLVDADPRWIVVQRDAMIDRRDDWRYRLFDIFARAPERPTQRPAYLESARTASQVVLAALQNGATPREAILAGFAAFSLDQTPVARNILGAMPATKTPVGERVVVEGERLVLPQQQQGAVQMGQGNSNPRPQMAF